LTSAIQIQGVTKTFGSKVAVSNLDLVIPQGSLYGFIGPNGAGKTTTIRMIMSIIFPDSGQLSVLGKSSAIESKDRIGYLPEERGLYRKMKVGPFLKYIATLKGQDSAGLDQKIKLWLDKVGLRDCFKKRCEELSKGMQQKVQFISAVIHEPDLIILDEPFSGLDPINRRLLRSLMDEQHKAGRTLIFSTHAMFEAEQLCTHLFMIHQGVKVLDLPLPEVWKRYDPKLVHVEPMGLVDEAASKLQGIHGVASVLATSGGVELRLKDNADTAAVMAAVTTRVSARKIELRRPSIEDIFVQLVGGDAAALKAELDGMHAPAANTSSDPFARHSPAGVES
jgi:ABC-2 type transport system ATP-binding protein